MIYDKEFAQKIISVMKDADTMLFDADDILESLEESNDSSDIKSKIQFHFRMLDDLNVIKLEPTGYYRLTVRAFDPYPL